MIMKADGDFQSF